MNSAKNPWVKHHGFEGLRCGNHLGAMYKEENRRLNTYPKPFSKILEGLADATRTYPQSTYAPRKQTTHVIYTKQDLLRSRKRTAREREKLSTTCCVSIVPSLQPCAMTELGRWPGSPFPTISASCLIGTILDNQASFVILEPSNGCQNRPDIITRFTRYVQLSIMHRHYHTIAATDAQWIHKPI